MHVVWAVCVVMVMALGVANGSHQHHHDRAYESLKGKLNQFLPTGPDTDDGDSDKEEGEPDKPGSGGEVVGEYMHPRRHFYVYWSLDEEEENVYFFMAAPTKSWFGIGFARFPSMPGADIVVGDVEQYQPELETDTNVTTEDYMGLQFFPVLTDRHADMHDRVMPALDEEQDVRLLNGSYVDGWSILEFERMISTGDETTDLSLEKARYMIWAIGAKGDIITEGGYGTFNHHERRGMVKVHFPSGTAEHYEDLTKEEAHASLMLFAWGLLAVLSIFCARYMKDPLGSWWFVLHVMLGIMVFACTIAGVSLIIDFVSSKKEPHFDSIHKIMGLVIAAGMVIQVFLGIYTRFTFDAERQRPPYWPDKVHWWVGRLVVVMAFTNIISGMLLFSELGDVPWFLVFFWFVVIAVYVGLFEGYFRGDTPDRATVAKEYELLERGIQVVRQNNSALLMCFGSLTVIGALFISLSVALLEK